MEIQFIEEPDARPENPSRLRRAAASVFAALALASGVTAASVVVNPAVASADQPKGGPYAPVSKPGYIEAWVDMNASCPGLACHTYFKIERSTYSGYRHMNGGWISGRPGWQKLITYKEKGCYNYRSVVESYIDAPVNSGSIGASGGVFQGSYNVNGMKRYYFKYPSSTTRICG